MRDAAALDRRQFLGAGMAFGAGAASLLAGLGLTRQAAARAGVNKSVGS